MKKKLLFMFCLLIFTGCGTTKEPASSSTTTKISADQESKAYDDAYYADQLCFCNITITGIETEWKDEYEMHMYDGVIKELADDYVIAEGHLTDEWNNTVDRVSVKYEIYDGSIESGDLIKTEAADDNTVLILTPSSPFSTDIIYDENNELLFYNTDLTKLSLTKENIPNIKLLDEWDNNYVYSGHIVFTDKDGNKWISSDEHLTNQFRYSFDTVLKNSKWKFNNSSIVVVSYNN